MKTINWLWRRAAELADAATAPASSEEISFVNRSRFLYGGRG